MPTHAETGHTANGGLGGAAKQVAEHASSIARLEVELALLEVKQKVVALGVGIGALLGAALFAVFMVGFAFATIAAAFATFLAWWAALLVVTGILALAVGGLGLLGLGALKKGSPPVPEQAIKEAKMTSAALKS
jgi:Putative Actinobacterial Holin-X, holin superfamily III